MIKIVLNLFLLVAFQQAQMTGCVNIVDSKLKAECFVNQYSEDFFVGEFEKFIRNFDKKYESNDEILKRYKIFKKNYKKILAHNSDNSKNYKQEVNRFTDLEDNEFEDQYLSQFVPDQIPKDSVRLGSQFEYSSDVRDTLNKELNLQNSQNQYQISNNYKPIQPLNYQNTQVQKINVTQQSLQQPQQTITPKIQQNVTQTTQQNITQKTQEITTQQKQEKTEKKPEEKSKRSYYYTYNKETQKIEKKYFDQLIGNFIQ